MAIELLAGIEGVVSIPLDQLITLWDAGFPGARTLQDRRLVNSAHVRLLSESHGRWPPISLVHFRDNERIISNYQPLEAYAVVDGRHRWEASKKLKYQVIRAVVGSYESLDHVVYTALLANRNHGIPSPPMLRIKSALWMYEHSNRSLDDIALIAGVTVRGMKQAMNRQIELQEEQEEQNIELSPIDSFATELYKSISNIRELSEQNGVYYTLNDDAQQVTSFIGGVVKQLPAGGRGDMYDFIDTIAGILGKVSN